MEETNPGLGLNNVDWSDFKARGGEKTSSEWMSVDTDRWIGERFTYSYGGFIYEFYLVSSQAKSPISLSATYINQQELWFWSVRGNCTLSFTVDEDWNPHLSIDEDVSLPFILPKNIVEKKIHKTKEPIFSTKSKRRVISGDYSGRYKLPPMDGFSQQEIGQIMPIGWVSDSWRGENILYNGLGEEVIINNNGELIVTAMFSHMNAYREVSTGPLALTLAYNSSGVLQYCKVDGFCSFEVRASMNGSLYLALNEVNLIPLRLLKDDIIAQIQKGERIFIQTTSNTQTTPALFGKS